jgi:guanylate kinase
VNPFLLILSSPSGGGKTTIAHRLIWARDDLEHSISATTRPPRGGEREGVDYYFLSRAEFERRRDDGDFLEWAEYSGALYGTLESEVERILARGRKPVLDIEVQGAGQVRERRSDVVSIFILPPSAAALVSRLEARALDDRESLTRRLAQADSELQQATAYDHVVVNDDLDMAVAAVAAIVDGEVERESHGPELERTISGLRAELTEITQQLSSQA